MYLKANELLDIPDVERFSSIFRFDYRENLDSLDLEINNKQNKSVPLWFELAFVWVVLSTNLVIAS